MPPGADVGGAANRQIGDGSVGQRAANAKGSQIKDSAIKNEKNGDSKGGDNGHALSARERLRLHVNRNLAQQEMAKTTVIEKGPGTARGSPAPPRGASPGNTYQFIFSGFPHRTFLFWCNIPASGLR
jgi:hypothetical protein